MPFFSCRFCLDMCGFGIKGFKERKRDMEFNSNNGRPMACYENGMMTSAVKSRLIYPVPDYLMAFELPWCFNLREETGQRVD